MDGLCGQCSQRFSDACEKQIYCSVHQAFCFSCKVCVQVKLMPAAEAEPEGQDQDQEEEEEKQDEAEIGQCSICLRRSEIEQLYFDYQCMKYICRFHFLKLDLKQQQTLLPCGDKQLTQDLAVYMAPFCLLCGRKLIRKSNNELGLCNICQSKGFSSADQHKNQKETIQKNAHQSKSNPQKEHQYQALRIQNQKLTNQLLLINQTLKVSQFTRKQIRRAIYHEERDKDCLICLQPFNLFSKKPMMLCIQQHLVCEKCLQEQTSLNHCPLCRDEINRSKILVSRQRLKTIQLQSIISQKYETKLQKCLEIQYRSMQKIEQPPITQIQPKKQKIEEAAQEKAQAKAAPAMTEEKALANNDTTSLSLTKVPQSVPNSQERRGRPMAGRKRRKI